MCLHALSVCVRLRVHDGTEAPEEGEEFGARLENRFPLPQVGSCTFLSAQRKRGAIAPLARGLPAGAKAFGFGLLRVRTGTCAQRRRSCGRYAASAPRMKLMSVTCRSPARRTTSAPRSSRGRPRGRHARRAPRSRRGRRRRRACAISNPRASRSSRPWPWRTPSWRR